MTSTKNILDDLLPMLAPSQPELHAHLAVLEVPSRRSWPSWLRARASAVICWRA